MMKVIKKYSGAHKGVMLEDIDSKLDLVLEQFSGMRKEIGENHEEFLGFKDEMLSFKGEMYSFKGDMLSFKDEMLSFRDETNKNFKVALEYLSKIDDEIQSLKAEIKELKTTLKGKAELLRVIEVEKRMTKIEKLVFSKMA